MIISDKYRFTLQWNAGTAEKAQAGDFLEGPGNKKSEFVVMAVAEYLLTHPDDLPSGTRPKLIVKQSYNREQLESLVKTIIEEKLSGTQAIVRGNTGSGGDISEIEADIDEMLMNLDLFEK